MHPIVYTALQAARKASDIILQPLERLDTIQVSTKGFQDFVTNIDKMAERAIIAMIKKSYPNHGIIAEESGQYKPHEEYIWIIDPLDGTHNYIYGLPHFCISIGFQKKGKLEHALVYDPIRQEIFSASRGCGAQMNDKRIRVSQTMRLEKVVLGTNFISKPQIPPALYLHDCLNHIIPKIAAVRCSGSTSLDLCYVASARLDACIETNLACWDMAAGALIITEAGGLVSDWQGGDKYLTKGHIMTANPKIFNILMPLIIAANKITSEPLTQ